MLPSDLTMNILLIIWILLVLMSLNILFRPQSALIFDFNKNKYTYYSFIL